MARTFIDPKEFALSFAEVASQKGINNTELVESAKQYLLYYLTARYLVEDFNEAEQENFVSASNGNEAKYADLSFNELMQRVKQLNKY